MAAVGDSGPSRTESGTGTEVIPPVAVLVIAIRVTARVEQRARALVRMVRDNGCKNTRRGLHVALRCAEVSLCGSQVVGAGVACDGLDLRATVVDRVDDVPPTLDAGAIRLHCVWCVVCDG